MMRRLFPIAATFALTGALLVGCSDDPDPIVASEPAPTADSSPSATADPGAVSHIFGETEIPTGVERIVALSSIDADTAAALGVPPILVPDAYGVGSIPPWLATASGDEQPEFLDATPADIGGNNLPFESIAAADPDLILGMNSGIDENSYKKLSAIAPTVAPQVGKYLDPWQDVTTTIGRALGQEERAQDLVDETEDAIAQAAEEHPEFEGATFVASLLLSADQFGVLVDEKESTVSLMEGLGFELKPEVDDLAPTSGYATQVSREQTSLLDADVAVIYAVSPDILADYESDPLFQRLDVVERDAVLAPDVLLWFSFRNPSVLTIPYALENAVPKLAELDFEGNA